MPKSAATDWHWLPIDARIQHKVCSLVYKCRHGNAPEYLSELLESHVVTREGLRGQDVVDRLKVPKTERQTFAARSFSVMGPVLWNRRPNELKMAETLDNFKSGLKTLLFKRSYP